jgi:hypothetical protein
VAELASDLPSTSNEETIEVSFGSKTGKAQSEHITSAIPPCADIAGACRHFALGHIRTS